MLEIKDLQKIPIGQDCYNASQELSELTYEKFKLDNFDDNYIGYLGENAVKEYLGLPFSEFIPYGGDGSIDANYNGLNINIKCKRLPEKYTFIWPKYNYGIKVDENSKSDIFLLTFYPENNLYKNTILVYGIVFKNDLLKFPKTLFTNKKGESGYIWDIPFNEIKFPGKTIEYITTHII